MPALPAPSNLMTPKRAHAFHARYEPTLRRLVRSITDTLMQRGYRVHFWTILTPEELVQAWSAELPYVTAAYVHYAPSDTQQHDAIHFRIDKATGKVVVWDGRGVLDREQAHS